MWEMQNLLTFVSSKKKILAYMTNNDQSFNDTLTNDIVSFEQLALLFKANDVVS